MFALCKNTRCVLLFWIILALREEYLPYLFQLQNFSQNSCESASEGQKETDENDVAKSIRLSAFSRIW